MLTRCFWNIKVNSLFLKGTLKLSQYSTQPAQYISSDDSDAASDDFDVEQNELAKELLQILLDNRLGELKAVSFYASHNNSFIQ